MAIPLSGTQLVHLFLTLQGVNERLSPELQGFLNGLERELFRHLSVEEAERLQQERAPFPEKIAPLRYLLSEEER